MNTNDNNNNNNPAARPRNNNNGGPAAARSRSRPRPNTPNTATTNSSSPPNKKPPPGNNRRGKQQQQHQPPTQRRSTPASDLNYEKLEQLLKEEKIVKTVLVTRKFLKLQSPQDVIPPRQLRVVFADIIGKMNWLEQLELTIPQQQQQQQQPLPQQQQQQKDETSPPPPLPPPPVSISGRLLASALTTTKRLEILKVHSGLFLEGARDVQSLATALSSHKDTLLELSFRNVKVPQEQQQQQQQGLFGKLAGALGSKGKNNSLLLEPIMVAAAECTKLKVLEVVCAADIPPPPPVTNPTTTTTTTTTTGRPRMFFSKSAQLTGTTLRKSPTTKLNNNDFLAASERGPRKKNDDDEFLAASERGTASTISEDTQNVSSSILGGFFSRGQQQQQQFETTEASEVSESSSSVLDNTDVVIAAADHNKQTMSNDESASASASRLRISSFFARSTTSSFDNNDDTLTKADEEKEKEETITTATATTTPDDMTPSSQQGRTIGAGISSFFKNRAQPTITTTSATDTQSTTIPKNTTSETTTATTTTTTTTTRPLMASLKKRFSGVDRAIQKTKEDGMVPPTERGTESEAEVISRQSWKADILSEFDTCPLPPPPPSSSSDTNDNDDDDDTENKNKNDNSNTTEKTVSPGEESNTTPPDNSDDDEKTNNNSSDGNAVAETKNTLPKKAKSVSTTVSNATSDTTRTQSTTASSTATAVVTTRTRQTPPRASSAKLPPTPSPIPTLPSPATENSTPLISPQSIAPLCESTCLKRLNLSNLSLVDDHFLMIAEKVAGNPKSVLTQLILNLNHNTDHGLDMILLQLLNKDDGTCHHRKSCITSDGGDYKKLSESFFGSTIKTFQAYQKERLISQATYNYLEGVLKRNVSLTNIRVHVGAAKSNKTLEFYIQLNKTGRRRLLDTQHTTWNQWVKLLANAANHNINSSNNNNNNNKSSPDLLYYYLRESTFWWKCAYFMALGNETAPAVEDGSGEARPWHHQPSSSFGGDEHDDNATGGDEGSRRRRRRRRGTSPDAYSSHSPPAISVDSNDDFDLDVNNDKKGDDDEVDILVDLKEKGLPETLDVAAHHDDHASHVSIVSLGDDTYVRDLVRQKEDREGLRQEEALEDALELYEIAKVEAKLQQDSDELFKVIFHQVLLDLDKQRKEQDKAHDELVERELYLKRVQMEQKEMKKKKDARRRSPVRGKSPVPPMAGAKPRTRPQTGTNGRNPAARPPNQQRPDGKAPPMRKNGNQQARPPANQPPPPQPAPNGSRGRDRRPANRA